jgi:hypothetical protein
MIEKHKLKQHVRQAVESLRLAINDRKGREEVLGIGFTTSDEVLSIGAFLLFSGDLPNDAELYQKLSPVEWSRSEEESFSALNNYLTSVSTLKGEDESDYRKRVRSVYDAFISILTDIDLREEYGSSLYLTFAGVDPNDILLEEEGRFVELLNPSHLYEQWSEEIG